MAKVTNLNIRIDRDLKIQADRLFNDMGMNLTTAVNVFVRQAILDRAIPFMIHRGSETAKTKTSVKERRAAMQEIRDTLTGIDGSSIDLDRMKEERRAARYERND